MNIPKHEIEEWARKDVEYRKDFIPLNPTRREQGFAIKDAFERGAKKMQEVIKAKKRWYDPRTW
jgi:hypothetical protein